jgi:preprotein translocase subunit SecD
MDRSLKVRTLILLGIMLLCAAILAPSTPGVSDSLPSWFPFKKKIQLGLDLQGGSHIVYSIALDKAVDDRASDIRRDLETRFNDEPKVKATVKTPSSPIGAVTVIAPDAAKKVEIEALIKSDYGETIESRECSDGPLAICFRVSNDFAERLKKSALAQAVTTIRERIDKTGVSEPTVVEKGDQIIVELPGLDKDIKAQTREIIARSAKLEFKVVDEGSDFMRRLYGHVGSKPKTGDPTEPRAVRDGIRADIDSWRPDEGGGRHNDWYLSAHDLRESLPLAEAQSPDINCVDKRGRYTRTGEKAAVEDGKVMCDLTGRQVIERYLADLAKQDPSFKVPDDRQVGYELEEPTRDAKDTRPFWRTYYLERSIELTGTAIADALGSFDQNTNRPVVLLDFNRFGSRVFGDLTARIVGKKLATILDGEVKSAPIINGAIRGGRAQISMGGSDPDRQQVERDKLVNVLKTGSLAASLREESYSDVGPTLGRDAISKTQTSFIIGIVLVILIMVGIYRWSGWISVFAVVWHIVMTLAVMALFGATLTLPGIAAIVLSIGMEVDGNILIYERIRDELLLGKSVRGAVDLGFSRAFSAILDGQLTTAAAAWVLLQYGSGPIKGFAVMLLVGVFTTVTTNTWVTRIFFDWYISRKKGQLATISI